MYFAVFAATMVTNYFFFYKTGVDITENYTLLWNNFTQHGIMMAATGVFNITYNYYMDVLNWSYKKVGRKFVALPASAVVVAADNGVVTKLLPPTLTATTHTTFEQDCLYSLQAQVSTV